MSRQLKPMPVTTEDARLGGVYVRHQNVEDSSRLKPFANAGHHFPRLIKMLKHVETCDHIKRFRPEGSVQNIAHKHLGAGPGFRCARSLS